MPPRQGRKAPPKPSKKRRDDLVHTTRPEPSPTQTQQLGGGGGGGAVPPPASAETYEIGETYDFFPRPSANYTGIGDGMPELELNEELMTAQDILVHYDGGLRKTQRSEVSVASFGIVFARKDSAAWISAWAVRIPNTVGLGLGTPRRTAPQDTRYECLRSMTWDSLRISTTMGQKFFPPPALPRFLSAAS